MKTGLSDVMFVPKWEEETFFREAQKVGFSGVEINFREKVGMLRKTTSLSDAYKLAHLAAAYHVNITSISSELFTYYAFTSSDMRLRKSGEEIARRMIEFAFEMDVKVINIMPGAVTAEMSYEKAYENAVESISRLGNEAMKAGIIIGVENSEKKFLPSSREFIGFLDDINHPSVKAYLNMGNALVTGYPEHFIDCLGDRIVGVHVKDYRQSIGSFTPVLDGDINWPSVMRALEKSGYNGYLVSTPSQEHKHGLERHIERYSKDIVALLNLLG